MPINFPSSANTGQIYTEGNYSYEFTGVKWKPVNRVDYSIQASGIQVANNATTIDFSLDGIQTLILSDNAEVTFANPPPVGEMKKVLVDLTANTGPTYSVTVEYDLENASYDNVNALLSSSLKHIYFKENGTKIFYTLENNSSVYQRDLSVPWDLGSLSGATSTNLSGQGSDKAGIYFKSDGTKMYVVDRSGDIDQYSLSTPWNVTTASYDSKFISTNDIVPEGLFINGNGTKLYVTTRGQNRLNEYTLSIPWDLSSASFITYITTLESTRLTGVFFSDDGHKVFVTGWGTDTVYMYNLTTPWSLASAVYSNVSLLVTSEDVTPIDIFFKADGTKMYLSGFSNGTVYQYSTGSSNTFASLQWPTNIEWQDGSAPALPDLTENMLVEIEARTDYLGTNYIGRLVGRNF